jgi:hypothetical protein
MQDSTAAQHGKNDLIPFITGFERIPGYSLLEN